MKVDKRAVLPDFMFNRLGWTNLYTIQAAYAVDVVLMAVYAYVHGTYHLTGFTRDTFIFVDLQSPYTEAVENRVYSTDRTECSAEESLDGYRKENYAQ